MKTPFPQMHPAVIPRHHLTAAVAVIALQMSGVAQAQSSVAQAQSSVANSELSRCRTLSDTAARLACYDALPLAATVPAAPAPAAAARPAATPVPAVTAAGQTAAAAAAPSAGPVATAPGPGGFGLEGSARKEAQEQSSSISGTFEGWGANSRIRLSNGQVWQVIDSSSAALYLRNPKVTVKRALLGDFVMEFAGSNRTAKVRRVE